LATLVRQRFGDPGVFGPLAIAVLRNSNARKKHWSDQLLRRKSWASGAFAGPQSRPERTTWVEGSLL